MRKNIVAAAANTNSVTVTFSTAANYPDIRIAEYAGLDPSNPLDVAVAAQGTSHIQQQRLGNDQQRQRSVGRRKFGADEDHGRRNGIHQPGDYQS